MKKLLFIGLLFISVASWGQTIANNPGLYTSVGTTTVTLTIAREHATDNTFTRAISKLLLVKVICPSTNAGTVQFGVLNNTVTGSPAYAAGESVVLSLYDTLYAKFTNVGDKIRIEWL